MKLFDYQKDILQQTKNRNRVAYYLDMGLGKTFVGSEKLMSFDTHLNLIICQKSKVGDWINHINRYYKDAYVIDLTNKGIKDLVPLKFYKKVVGIINYDLLMYRPNITKITDFSLLCDESSMIKNSQAKRTQLVMRMKFKNVVLLSGTPCGGKYEELYTQCKMLGWKINKEDFLDRYTITKRINVFSPKTITKTIDINVVIGYKNIPDLKHNLKNLGCVFMKSDEVISLPKVNVIPIKCESEHSQVEFKRNRVITFKVNKNVKTLVANTKIDLLNMCRLLAGVYNTNKLNAVKGILNSTDDRLIIFYNFWEEFNTLVKLCEHEGKPIATCNGRGINLTKFKDCSNAVLLVQYQSGAMGLNLQECNKIIYFTPPLSSELFEQSKKRIHRIGQERPCFYYQLVTKDSVEQQIYFNLRLRKDYTTKLFENDL